MTSSRGCLRTGVNGKTRGRGVNSPPQPSTRPSHRFHPPPVPLVGEGEETDLGHETPPRPPERRGITTQCHFHAGRETRPLRPTLSLAELTAGVSTTTSNRRRRAARIPTNSSSHSPTPNPPPLPTSYGGKGSGNTSYSLVPTRFHYPTPTPDYYSGLRG